MTDPRTEYLESLHREFAATQQLLGGVDLILQGGTEGIATVANTQPDVILAVLAGMGAVIKQLQKEVIDEAERRFNLLDEIEKIDPNA